MENQQNSGYDSSKNRINRDAEDFERQSRNTGNETWNQTPPPYNQENKKILAGILGIVLGGFGVHKFILGYTQEGIIQIVITVVTCGMGSIIGLIEGIIYLTKTDEEFYQTYQVGKKGWF
ncbi:TM2 domain-containing protein [Aequorivita echinoideorum]|uniref:TM2 domain-containing protein n=1 Tax=Aequorivita echinoideorum TaxID=1549647 RepID=A0ABS5S1W9_9FLAO|nr:TM2 domain-containing protein [Aequorivita echinoideorum]MBT0607196.1 TM2 domain-containing protein [Aequorivita echinoideorum]